MNKPRLLACIGGVLLVAAPAFSATTLTQTLLSYFSSRPSVSSTQSGDAIMLLRGGATYQIPATSLGGGGTGANPSATASDVAANGVATTFMRSDGAPAIQKASDAQFGLVKGDGITISCVAGLCSSLTGGAGTVTNSANLTNNALVAGNGGTVGIKTITTGTGVTTALGVNVGSAGAFVVNGGALGTPSSGTLSAATGLPVSTGISGLGTGVATALGINTGSAGSHVVNGGALGTPSSGVATNLTGTAAGLTAGTVTTNANLTGPVTSAGNATAIAAGAIALSKIGGEVDGDCILGAGGVWTAGSCGGASSVSVTAGTPDIVVTPSPGTGTFTVGTTIAQNAPADGGSHSYTVVSGDIAKEIDLVSTFTALVVPQATGSFAAGTSFTECHSGTITATSTTSTINGIAGATGLKLGPLQCSTWSSSSGQWAVAIGVPTDLTQRSTAFLAGDNVWRVPAGGGDVTASGTLTSGKIAIGGGTTVVSVDASAGLSAGALSLGASGTAGSVALGNATSGTITLQPVTGALGTVTASLPANTGTIAELNLAQSWTAKQTMTASGPLELGANSGNVGSVKIYGNTSGDAIITVPAAAGTATRFQLPATNGSNTNVLQTDGSGNTSWVAAGGGGITCPTSFTAVRGQCVWTKTAATDATNCPTGKRCIFFTGLANDEYDMRCHGIQATSASANLAVRYGEGGTPTYGTGATAYNQTYSSQNAAVEKTNQTTDGLFAPFQPPTSGADSTNMFYRFHDFTSTTLYKYAQFEVTDTTFTGSGFGYYSTDTNAITAIQLIDHQGTPDHIDGTCTLIAKGY